MRFFFFSKGDKSVASSRYRAYYLAEALLALGHEAVVTLVAVHSFSDFARYLRLLLNARRRDVVFLQRTIYSRAFIVAVLIARVLGRRFIFDIDDAVWQPPAKRTAFLARLAFLVTCGSAPALRWARSKKRPALLLSNGLPLSVYVARSEESPGIPLVGWIGDGPAHAENLKLLVPVLDALRNEGTPFRFRLIGAMGDRRIYDLFGGATDVDIIDTLDWSDPRRAVSEIQRFAIGVMPLASSEWNQAKYFKALEYMAAGVPVVASRAEALVPIVEGNAAGVLVTDTEEWVRTLRNLLSNAPERAKLGSQGRAALERDYSSTAMAKTLLTELGDAALSPVPSHAPDVSIVVLNWNTSDLLADSLRAILSETKQVRYELIAIDNHSDDGGFERLPPELRRDPRIRFVTTAENTGWKAINGPFASARGRYLATIDADARVKEGCVDALVAFMDTHADAGAATANLLFPDGSPQVYFRRLYRPATFWWASVPGRAIDHLFFRSRHRLWARYEDVDPAQLFEVEQPSWPALIIRREALRGQAMVNPLFPFHFVDVDLSRRLAAAGYRTFVVPGAYAVHFKSTSYKRANQSWRTRDYDRSLRRYFRRYYPLSAPFLSIAVFFDRVGKTILGYVGIAL